MKSALIVLFAASCALAGCAVVNESAVRYADAPAPAARTGWVQVLRSEPWRSYDKLGEVVVESSTNPALSVDEIESRLRAAGASLGGEAVVITVDRYVPADPRQSRAASLMFTP